jgi:nucleoredoxin
MKLFAFLLSFALFGTGIVGEEATATAEATDATTTTAPVQSGPLVDLFGPNLLSLEMIDENTAQFVQHATTDALRGKKVIGLYFSADWCGPCRQFTPELVQFYKKMNARRGKKDQFEIIWISRCRDVDSYGQYFTQMNWMALPHEEAAGQRGQMLGEKYQVKGIPSLVLLDDLGQVITLDARNKIPQDKAGIGFPWRSPLAQVYSLIPKSLRLMVKSQVDNVRSKVVQKIKTMVGLRPKPASA